MREAGRQGLPILTFRGFKPLRGRVVAKLVNQVLADARGCLAVAFDVGKREDNRDYPECERDGMS